MDSHTGRPEDPEPRPSLAPHKALGDFTMTHALSQRIDSAFSTLAMVGLLSPLVLAAFSIIFAAH
jgi:hypothetical protein